MYSKYLSLIPFSVGREEFERLFLEGKWFYNNLLSIRQEQHVKLTEINTTRIKIVEHLDKDKNKLVDDLTVLTSQVKQAILTRMVSNEKTIAQLVKRGFQKQGSLNLLMQRINWMLQWRNLRLRSGH